ncbi:MAG: hypothetical protein ABIN25_00355, partial [Ginsengibacter sp.]
PVIDYKAISNPIAAHHSTSTLPVVKIDHLLMLEPRVEVATQQGASLISLLLPYSSGNKIEGDFIRLADDSLSVASLKIKAEKATFKNGKTSIAIDKGVAASVSKIHIPLKGNNNEWNATITDLDVTNSQAFSFDIKGNKLSLKDIKAGGISVSASSAGDIRKLVNTNPDAWISTSSTEYVTKNSIWLFRKPTYKGDRNELAVDSVSYHPLLSREVAIQSNPYQMDYIDFNSGNVVFSGIKAENIFKENYLSVENASISNPSVNIYRDKLPPFQFGRKKMITEQIREIHLPLLIEKIAIKNGNVNYTERTEKTRQEGNLLLSHLNGNISNLKNTRLLNTDSLAILLSGSFLDKTPFDVSIRQSYLDSLYGFSVSLHIQPYAMEILNPLVAPLSSVKFVYGDIDKFEMEAVGNENFAHGEMKLYYHDLRIQLLKNGGLQKTNFIKKVESDLINFFFLKNKNTSGTGLIYFKRLKDYSFFNYLNKIIFSGITTNISQRRNRKFAKIYRKNNISTLAPGKGKR